MIARDSTLPPRARESPPGAILVRVAIVEDHPLYALALESVIHAAHRLALAGSFHDAPSALRAIDALQADVLLLDMHLGEASGLAVLEAVSAATLGVHVLVLSADDSPAAIHEALARGAAGYVLKDAGPDAIVASIEAAARGETVLSRALQAAVASEIRRISQTARPDLTAREADVLALSAQGLARSAVAAELFVSPATVKAHLANAYRKLEVTGRSAAVARALELDVIQLAADGNYVPVAKAGAANALVRASTR